MLLVDLDLVDPADHYYYIPDQKIKEMSKPAHKSILMRITIAIFLIAVISDFSQAQVVIGANTSLASAANTDIVINSAGNLVNNSTFDFASTNLQIDLSESASVISGNWNLKRFRLNTTGIINVSGNFTVTQRLDLSSGILHSQTGKISYTGPSNGLSINASGASYIDGAFYQTGNGDRIFPIGTATTFAPIRFLEIRTDAEIGVQAFGGNPQLQPDNVKVLEIVTGRYWKITTADPTKIDSRVNVGLQGVTIPTDGMPVVVQADQVNIPASDLGNSSSNADNITSDRPVTASLLAIGKESEIKVRVHDLITPFTKDEINDALYVENIERFNFRKVTLLDRWGVVIRVWDEYTNINSFDFGTLSPGNYMCIVEYGNAGGKTSTLSQMVTVLKTY
jgi:hypothetical protein